MKKAGELFIKFGYKAVSMDQIAFESGISKMTIYKHFHSKDDLFAAVLMDLTTFHINRIEEALSDCDHTLEKIECLYDYSLQNIAAFPEQLLRDTVERPHVMQVVTEFKQKWIHDLWERILLSGMEKGDIRGLDPSFIATLLMHMPTAFLQTDYVSSPEKLKVFTENFYDFIKFGLIGDKQTQTLKR